MVKTLHFQCGGTSSTSGWGIKFLHTCCSAGKESTCNARDLGSIPGLERSSGGGHGNLLQQSCLENPHGRRSLVGYSPWSPIELDMDE